MSASASVSGGTNAASDESMRVDRALHPASSSEATSNGASRSVDILVSHQREELRKIRASHHFFINPRGARQLLATDRSPQAVGHTLDIALNQFRGYRPPVVHLG